MRKINFGAWLVGVLTILCPLMVMGAYIPGTMLGSNNLSEITNSSTARTNLGLGSIATAATSSYFATANNLSEGTAATMRTNIGVGTISTQAANSVAITGGAIDGTTVGATTRSSVKGTTGDFSGILTTGSGAVRFVRVVIASGAVTMATTDDVVVVNKTSGAATTVNFVSSPTTGTVQCVKDGKGDAATNNITLTPAAGNIDGASTFVMNQNYEAICFVYNATQWNIL